MAQSRSLILRRRTMSKTKKTLLVIVPNEGINCVFNILVAKTGEGLASHLCSHAGFAYDDLYGTRVERKEEWIKRFGELEVKFIGETDLTEETLIERNKKWFAEYEAKKVKEEPESESNEQKHK